MKDYKTKLSDSCDKLYIAKLLHKNRKKNVIL